MIEPFGASAVLVREVPSLLGTSGVKGLLADLAAELAETEDEGGRRASSLGASIMFCRPWPAMAA